MTFILCSHNHPKMALYGNRSSTIENLTLKVARSTWTGSITSLKDVVATLLNPGRTRLRFFKADGGYLICLLADIYNKSAKQPKSTRILRTSNPLSPNVSTKASLCKRITRLGLIGRNVIGPLISRALSTVKVY